MGIIKLAEAGSEAVLTITNCEAVEGKFGMQVRFDADNGDTLYVPESSVERQMDRFGAESYSDVVGMTLRFYRAPNNKGGSPYWNIDKAREGDTAPKAPKLLPNETGSEDYLDDFMALPENGVADKPAKAPAKAQPLYVATDFAGLIVKYKQCVSAATEAWGDNTGDDALVAACATLFIARNQMKI